jgi:hypothetical protein
MARVPSAAAGITIFEDLSRPYWKEEAKKEYMV